VALYLYFNILVVSGYCLSIHTYKFNNVAYCYYLCSLIGLVLWLMIVIV